MRFLADECLDRRLIEGLRDPGHDVAAVRDIRRGASDRSVLESARREHRALVTEDKGFGDLVVRRGLSVPGVVLVRYAQSDVFAVRDRLLALIGRHGERLHRPVRRRDRPRGRGCATSARRAPGRGNRCSGRR